MNHEIFAHEIAKITTFTKILPLEKYPLYGRLKNSLSSRPPHSVRILIVRRQLMFEKLNIQKMGKAWAETSREGRLLVGVARNFSRYQTF